MREERRKKTACNEKKNQEEKENEKDDGQRDKRKRREGKREQISSLFSSFILPSRSLHLLFFIFFVVCLYSPGLPFFLFSSLSIDQPFFLLLTRLPQASASLLSLSRSLSLPSPPFFSQNLFFLSLSLSPFLFLLFSSFLLMKTIISTATKSSFYRRFSRTRRDAVHVWCIYTR